MKKIIVWLVLSFVCAVAYALPRPSQIEDALAGKHYGEAKSMVDEVLRERPDSARAHLLNAYLLAHVDHNRAAANTELQTAVGLDKRGDVKSSALFGRVVAEIDAQSAGRTVAAAQHPAPVPAPHAADGIDWALIILPGLVVGLILYYILRPSRKSSVTTPFPTTAAYASTFRESYPDPLASRARATPAPTAPEPYYPAQQSAPSALGTVAAVAGGVMAGNAMSAMLMGGHSSHRHDDEDEQRRRRARDEEEEERRRRDSWSTTYSDPSPVSTSSERSSFSSSSSGSDSWSSSSSYDSGSSSDWGSSSSSSSSDW
jgi:hypothetical protein